MGRNTGQEREKKSRMKKRNSLQSKKRRQAYGDTWKNAVAKSLI